MSRYRNAADVLPAALLAKLQQYVAGEVLYVPRDRTQRIAWGERSGAREALRQRNQEICQRRAEGATIEQLMAEFHLGYDSIRKIIGRKEWL